MFFAFAGAKADGRQFAAQAIARGAIAVISEAPEPPDFDGLWLRVSHGRQALATAAGNFYQHPDRRLKIIGVTGTNGKTTTTYLIDSILTAAGLTTALVGTIEYRLAGRQLPSINTTPESLDLFGMFTELESLGGTHVTMETSSHALSLGRVHGIQFETAVFTNLTRDHLDFHGSMDAYLDAKRMLFTSESSPGPGMPSSIMTTSTHPNRIRPQRRSSRMVWEKEHRRGRNASQPVSTGSALRFTTQAKATRWSRRWSAKSMFTTSWQHGARPIVSGSGRK